MLVYTFYVIFFVFLSVVDGRIRVSVSCRGPRQGTCVNVWKCPYYADLLGMNPRPPFLIKQMKANLCGFVNQETPKVCCSNLTQTKTNEATINLLPMDICGEILHSSRIMEGGNASPREFPWMVLIAYKTGESSNDEEFRCGGTLIHERYVLTAAHCLEDNTVIGVRLGEFNLKTERDCDDNGQKCESVQDVLIKKIIIHPQYNSRTFSNDIALIKLATPASLTANVKPICLPRDELLTMKMVGKFVTITGWGVTETGHKSLILKKTSIPIVPLIKCKHLYGKFKPITKNQICAGGYKGRDSCSGDSGGPLQYIAPVGQSHRYVQDGIVSYGLSHCGVVDKPAIYTNVREYMTWILSNIEPE